MHSQQDLKKKKSFERFEKITYRNVYNVHNALK